MTKAIETKLKSGLKKLEKCNGDCIHCEKFHCYFADSENALYMAYGCDLLPIENFSSISDSVRTLRADAIETAKFELSINSIWADN